MLESIDPTDERLWDGIEIPFLGNRKEKMEPVEHPLLSRYVYRI